MKQLFHITNSRADMVQQVLCLRTGDHHISFAVTNKTGTELYQLAYCVAEEWSEKELNDLLSTYPVLKSNFNEVFISFDHTQNLLIPSTPGISQSSADMLQIQGLPGQGEEMRSESIPRWQLINLFSVPGETINWISVNFPGAKTLQQYSLELNQTTSEVPGILKIDFRKNDFTVVATKESKFLLAKAFEYETPEDVIYYLIRICTEFSLSQKEVQLQLSGLLDKRSALYRDIHQYFIHIEFMESSWELGEDYPAHFFTSLNELAKCAS